MIIDTLLLIFLVAVTVYSMLLIKYIKKFHITKIEILKLTSSISNMIVQGTNTIASLEKVINNAKNIKQLITATESQINELSVISKSLEKVILTINEDSNSCKKSYTNKIDNLVVEKNKQGFLNQSKYFNSLRKIRVEDAT